MLALLIIVVNVIISGFSIYIFDYNVDGKINNLFIILLCLLCSLFITLILLGLFLEIFYLSLKKGKKKRSMFSHKVAKQVLGVPIHFLRIKLKVVGKENIPKNTGFTVYSNHSSWIDLPFLIYGIYDNPVAALGKEGAFKIFAVGRFAPKFGCVMIHRKDPRQSAKAIKEVVTNVKNGLSMIIFPEGTRSPIVNSMLDFKDGAFKAALRSERPLLPITIIKPINYKKIKWPFVKRVTILVHPPLLYDDFKLLKSYELSQKVKEIIGGALINE